MKKWVIEKLNAKLHGRENFSSSAEVLNVYLKTRANQEQEKNLNITYVVTISGGIQQPIIGYYTLSSSSLKRVDMPVLLQKGIPPSYDIPSILIGRLAVDQRYERQGVGKFLLKSAFANILDTAVISAVKLVTVVAKHDSAIAFYEKFGFTKLNDVNQLVLPVETLLKARSERK